MTNEIDDECIRENIKKTVINMLEQKLSMDLIKQVTGLDEEEILRIKYEILPQN